MHRQPHGVRGGRLDWTKARKVAVLQRQLRLPNSYRSWIHDSADHFLLLHEAAYAQTTLHTWLSEFARSTITLENKINVETKRTQTEVTTTLPHSDTCDGCLDGVLGSTAGAEQCNMTWGQGENFYTVAAKFQTDWMALWSLNGGDAPDVAKVMRLVGLVMGVARSMLQSEQIGVARSSRSLVQSRRSSARKLQPACPCSPDDALLSTHRCPPSTVLRMNTTCGRGRHWKQLP